MIANQKSTPSVSNTLANQKSPVSDKKKFQTDILLLAFLSTP
jgi:hypothetical protein